MEGNIPLSVVILTKNEAARIRDCIASVAWAGEVLVVDDESTDETVAIAEALGARVLRRKMDVEGRHRNWAYAQAAHEWILSLDADERVTPELAQEIQALFRGQDDGFETYAIPRRNYIGSRWIRHGGWYPSAQLKLFKRSVFRWEETTVHPRAFANVPCGTLRADLLHYSYRDLGDFVEKLNRQTTLEAEKWLRDGRRMTLAKALWRTADRALRSYVGKRGYRDGLWGLIVAALAGMYQLLAWAKYYERRQALRIEEVIRPFRTLVVDQERHDSALLMSHLCAYRLTGRLAADKHLLEIGFGTGYGAYYLAHLARHVTAIDVDAGLVAQAGRLFRRDNLQYAAMPGTQLAFPDHAFDVVGTFQVIEHIPEPALPTFLREIARVLTAGGTLVVSTLNLEHNLKQGKTAYRKAPFHEKEFRPEEFRALLTSVFPSVEVYGLYPRVRYRVMRRLKKWGLHRVGPRAWNPVTRFYQRLSTDDHVLRRRITHQAIDLIGICRTSHERGPGTVAGRT